MYLKYYPQQTDANRSRLFDVLKQHALPCNFATNNDLCCTMWWAIVTSTALIAMDVELSDLNEY